MIVRTLGSLVTTLALSLAVADAQAKLELVEALPATIDQQTLKPLPIRAKPEGQVQDIKKILVCETVNGISFAKMPPCVKLFTSESAVESDPAVDVVIVSSPLVMTPRDWDAVVFARMFRGMAASPKVYQLLRARVNSDDSYAVVMPGTGGQYGLELLYNLYLLKIGGLVLDLP